MMRKTLLAGLLALALPALASAATVGPPYSATAQDQARFEADFYNVLIARMPVLNGDGGSPSHITNSSLSVTLSGGSVNVGNWPGSFGISGTLPPFAATPTFNLGTLNGAALDASVTTTNTDLGAPGSTVCATDTGSCSINAQFQRLLQRTSALISAVGSPLQAGGTVNVGNFPTKQTIAISQSGTDNQVLCSNCGGGSSVSSTQLPSALGPQTPAGSLSITSPADATFSGSITAADAASSSTPGQNSVNVVTGTPATNSWINLGAVNAGSAVGAHVDGTFVGSITFATSIDGVHWTLRNPTQDGYGGQPVAVTAPGDFHLDIASTGYVMIKATSWTSGTATVSGRVTSSPGLTKIMNAGRLVLSNGADPSNTTYGGFNVGSPDCAIVTIGCENDGYASNYTGSWSTTALLKGLWYQLAQVISNQGNPTTVYQGTPIWQGGGISTTAVPTAGAGGSPVEAMYTPSGKAVVAAWAPDGLRDRGAASTASNTAQAFTSWSAPATGIFAYITSIQCHREDTGTTAIHATLNDTASTVIGLPAGGGNTISYSVPLKVSASATAPTFTLSTSVSGGNVYCSAQGFHDN